MDLSYADSKRRIIAKLEDENTHLLEEISTLRTQEASRRAALMEQHKRTLDGEREMNQHEVSKLRAELEETANKLKHLQSTTDKSAQLEKDLALSSAAVEALNTTNAKMEQYQKQLENELRNAQQALQAKLSMEGKVAALDTIRSGLEEKLEEASRTTASLTKQLEDALRTNAAKDDKLRVLGVEQERLTAALKDEAARVLKLDEQARHEMALAKEYKEACDTAQAATRQAESQCGEQVDLAKSVQRTKQREVDELTLRLAQAESRAQQFAQRTSLLEVSLEEARSEGASLRGKLQEAQKVSDAQSTQLSKLQVLSLGQENELGERRGKESSLQAELEEIHAELQTTKDSLAAAQQRVAVLSDAEEKVRVLQGIIDRQQADMGAANGQLELHREKLFDAETTAHKHAALLEAYRKADSQLHVQGEAVDMLMAERRTLSLQLKHAKQTAEECIIQLRVMEKRLESEKLKRAEAESRFAAARESSESAFQRLSTLRDAVFAETSESSKAQQLNNALLAEVQHLESLCKEHEDTITQLEQDKAGLELRVAETDARVEQLKTEGVNSELLSQEKDKVKKELDHLTAEFAIAAAVDRESRETLVADLDRHRVEKESLEHTTEELRRKLETVEADLLHEKSVLVQTQAALNSEVEARAREEKRHTEVVKQTEDRYQSLLEQLQASSRSTSDERAAMLLVAKDREISQLRGTTAQLRSDLEVETRARNEATELLRQYQNDTPGGTATYWRSVCEKVEAELEAQRMRFVSQEDRISSLSQQLELCIAELTERRGQCKKDEEPSLLPTNATAQGHGAASPKAARTAPRLASSQPTTKRASPGVSTDMRSTPRRVAPRASASKGIAEEAGSSSTSPRRSLASTHGTVWSPARPIAL